MASNSDQANSVCERLAALGPHVDGLIASAPENDASLARLAGALFSQDDGEVRERNGVIE
jgi:hypothetical protein